MGKSRLDTNPSHFSIGTRAELFTTSGTIASFGLASFGPTISSSTAVRANHFGGIGTSWGTTSTPIHSANASQRLAAKPLPRSIGAAYHFYPDALALLQPRAPLQQAQVESTAPFANGITLVSSNPSNGQRGIPIDQNIHLRFDRQLPAGITGLAFGIQPPVEVAFDIQGNELIFQPLQLLSYSTDYRILLPAAKELDLQKPIELTFRTEPQYSYQRDIKPLLEASCVGCHQQAGRMRRSPLDSYAAVMRYVTPGSENSELLKPRWLARHAVIQRAAGIRLNGGGVDALSLLSQGREGAEPTPRVPVSDPQGESPGSFIGRSGSPELAYIRRNGTGMDRLGHLSADEIQILRTWIIQDQAAEAHKS
jgi:hypothetical protein